MCRPPHGHLLHLTQPCKCKRRLRPLFARYVVLGKSNAKTCLMVLMFAAVTCETHQTHSLTTCTSENLYAVSQDWRVHLAHISLRKNWLQGTTTGDKNELLWKHQINYQTLPAQFRKVYGDCVMYHRLCADQSCATEHSVLRGHIATGHFHRQKEANAGCQAKARWHASRAPGHGACLAS